MLPVNVITIHPAFVKNYAGFGVLNRAVQKGSLEFNVINLRDFAVDRHGSVDASPYGGGDGMVMRPEPLAAAVNSLGPVRHVILTSPGGKPFTHQDALRLSQSEKPLVFICGRFGGVDERFIEHYVDEEFSMGDFVVSGGELPVLTMVDALTRLLEGSLGHPESAMNDSFAKGMEGLLEYPLYTRPPLFEGETIPPVLTSGDHAAITAWRRKMARERTVKKRPDLL